MGTESGPEDIVPPVAHIEDYQATGGMSEDDLNKFYSDIYGFNMCNFCGLPTPDFCCSQGCYTAYFVDVEIDEDE